jgi:WD40 repeat protein
MLSPVFAREGSKLAVANDDGTVTMWNLASGREVYRVRAALSRPGYYDRGGIRIGEGRFTSGASLVDISADGRWLVTAEPGVPGRAVLRRAEDGRPVHVLKVPASKGAWSVAFSPRGDRIAVLDFLPGAVCVFDVATGRPVPCQPVGTSLMSVDWSPDGRQIAVGGNDAVISIVDATKGVVTETLGGHAEPVTAVAFSPDGTRLASAGWRANTLVWDRSPTSPGELAAYPANLVDVAQALPDPGGKWIYTSGFFSKTVSALDAVTLSIVSTVPSQWIDERVNLTLSPDGRWLATTNPKGVTTIRDAKTLRGRFVLPRGLHVKAFSPDGARVLADANKGKAAPRVLEVASGRIVFSVHGSIEAAEWSPDGSLLATASFDRFARVYDARSGQLLATIPAHVVEATDVAFRPDGSQLAVSSHDVVIYDVAAVRDGRLEVVATLPSRSGSTNIQMVQFTPDGATLVTGSLTSGLGVWDTSRWELEYTIPTIGPSAGMTVLPSGREVVAGYPIPVVYTLNVDRLIEIARKRLTRSFTTAECIRYLHVDECPTPEPS